MCFTLLYRARNVYERYTFYEMYCNTITEIHFNAMCKMHVRSGEVRLECRHRPAGARGMVRLTPATIIIIIIIFVLILVIIIIIIVHPNGIGEDSPH